MCRTADVSDARSQTLGSIVWAGPAVTTIRLATDAMTRWPDRATVVRSGPPMKPPTWMSSVIDEATFERLAAEFSGSDLHSVLLEVMRRRASARTPVDVLAQYERDGLSRPAAVDQRTSTAIDAQLFAAA